MLDRAMFVVALLGLGTALIFAFTDGRSSATRALVVALGCSGLSLLQSSMPDATGGWLVWAQLLDLLLETTAILAGMEYGRRIAREGEGRLVASAMNLFRVAQLLTLVFALLAFIFILVLPDHVARDAGDVVAMRPLQWAVYVPVLGSGVLLAFIAVCLLHVGRIDTAERIRLRALMFSGAFFLFSLILGDAWVPISMTLGFIIFLGGSVQYFQLQSQRGAFMREFLSPEVVGVLNQQGIAAIEERQRIVVTALFVDLRGFTAFARAVDSDQAITALERYYSLVGALAHEHGGMVKDHAGDGVLVLFGVPLAMENRAQRAVDLARHLRDELSRLLPDIDSGLGVGIGLASGKVSAGAIQGAGRMEYVAVGSAVNLAARLCDQAQDGEIWIDSHTKDELTELATAQALSIPFKGFADPIQVFRLA